MHEHKVKSFAYIGAELIAKKVVAAIKFPVGKDSARFVLWVEFSVSHRRLIAHKTSSSLKFSTVPVSLNVLGTDGSDGDLIVALGELKILPSSQNLPLSQ